MAKVIRLEMMMEMGVTSLGKYTLPNRCALDVKVFEVPVRQLEKYPHITVPDI